VLDAEKMINLVNLYTVSKVQNVDFDEITKEKQRVTRRWRASMRAGARADRRSSPAAEATESCVLTRYTKHASKKDGLAKTGRRPRQEGVRSGAIAWRTRSHNRESSCRQASSPSLSDQDPCLASGKTRIMPQPMQGVRPNHVAAPFPGTSPRRVAVLLAFSLL